jgi:hypothetical protein
MVLFVTCTTSCLGCVRKKLDRYGRVGMWCHSCADFMPHKLDRDIGKRSTELR